MTFTEERLSIDKHFDMVGDFCSGADNPLDIFISCEAFDYDDKKYGNTYVLRLMQSKNEIICFYTLKANGIQVFEKGEYNSVPVIEIARIAVQYNLQDNGLGKYAFYTYIIPKIKNVVKNVAVKAIIAFVDLEDKKNIGFYNSLGFEKATEVIKNEIKDTFNMECDLYIASLERKY